MAEWRYLRGWTESELSRRLEDASSLRLNFSLKEKKTPERGWNHVRSRALIAYEDRGAPVEGDTFGRLWRSVEKFEHSDPRIVIAHFREAVPFSQRSLLLELRALGLRYLCPAKVGASHVESNLDATVHCFAVDTLEGHIERGREWFILEKDHATGEIQFHIEAAWRAGDFPNRWSRAGFHLVGRRYQRAWHRLAHLRLRRLAAGLEPHAQIGPQGVAHEGPSLPTAPVQFFAQQHLGGRQLQVEERED